MLNGAGALRAGQPNSQMSNSAESKAKLKLQLHELKTCNL